MPEPSARSREADTRPAVCGHTHLFPGARCRVQGLSDPRAFAADPWPVELDLRFSDGVVADAVLRTGGPEGAVLVVPPYTTGAGTSIDGRTWTIREFAGTGERWS
ncbi:hypothetical protein [Streptomyces sp. ICBB 8177]|uniref:hypothetical protein n=1 Tax=Streptomyces sp. ICBB 8177 TaxID=563922 RepID=UPI001F547FE3|nr:hypothetical protein [Streptomyces sp. ICBB 8177]